MNKIETSKKTNFNSLKTSDKWKQYKTQTGKWACGTLWRNYG